MPAGLFKKTLDQVEKAKEDRRMAKTAAIRKEYDDNPKKQFELTTAQRPTVAKVQEAKAEPERIADYAKAAQLTEEAAKAEGTKDPECR